MYTINKLIKNTRLTSAIIAMLIMTSNSLFAHFGPRGLLGGSIQVGIEYNGIVYLGTKGAGVFESTNNQLVGWRARPVGLKSGYITALAHSGSELYAATADSGVYIFNGVEGTDRFWNKRNNGLGSLNILSLLALDANTIFAGTDGDGLYTTSDKGLNWTAVNSSLLNNKKIAALTKGGSRLFALIEDGGVFASDDNGATWFDLNDANTLDKLESEHFTYNATTDELLVSNEDGLWILASASTTSSATYTDVSTGLATTIHIHCLTNNGTNWYLGSHSGVYTTPSSSINWTSANTGITTTNIGALVVAGNSIIAGTSKKGVFKSATSTINWVSNNTGMTNIHVYSVSCKGDSTVATATEYGVTISKTIGTNPVLRNSGLIDSLNVTDLEFAENLLFAATSSGGVYVTSNLGLNWTTQNGGLSNLNVKRIIYGNGRKYIIDSDGKLFQSELNGTTWADANNGLPTNAIVTSLTFYANNLVIGTLGNGVYVKQRDAASWSAFNTGLNDMNITGVAYAADKLYAGTDGSGVFVSNTNTAAWTATAPISISHFNNVSLDPSHIQYMTTVKDWVIATFKGGVVGTTDGGNTWEPAGNQFNLPSYTNIYKASYVKSRLFVTSEKNSAYAQGMGELASLDTVLTVNATTVNALQAGLVSYHSVTSNVKWKITSSESWVKVNPDSVNWNSNEKLTIEANNTGAMRTATVTLSSGTYKTTITVNQDAITSINNIDENNSIKVYPNPNKGQFTLDVSQYNVESVSIFNITGELLTTIPVQNKNTVDISSNLLSGIYFVKIQTANGSAVKRIVVE
jgi:photosystem II stability/assembly factor-like uncharacterized protein